MNIEDIATREYVEVDVDERLGKVRSVFERQNPKGIIVTTDGAYEGVITEKQLLQSHVEDDAKAGAMVQNAPKVTRTENVRDVARQLVEGGVKVAPVFENDALWGIVSEDAILDAVLENLDVLAVEEIATDDVVTVTEDDHVGQAINAMREEGISRNLSETSVMVARTSSRGSVSSRWTFVIWTSIASSSVYESARRTSVFVRMPAIRRSSPPGVTTRPA